MSYTLAKIVDQVYLAVTGGIPSDDINVERADIRNLAPGAINIAVDKHVKTQLGEWQQDYRELGIGRGAIAHDLYLNYNLTVNTDTARNLDYLLLPSAVMYLPGDAGFRQAYIPGGDTAVSFRRVANASRLKGLPDFTGVVFMWVEKTSTENRIYLRGLGMPKPDNIMVRAALSVGDLGYNDVLAITDSAALDAILILTEYFSKQREIPEDATNTGIDEKV